MIEYDVEITGWDALEQSMYGLEINTIEKAGNALVRLGQRIVQEIVDHYVPVYTGLEGANTKGFSPKIARQSLVIVHNYPAVSPMGAHTVRQGGTLRNSVNSDEVARFTQDGAEVSIWAGREGSGAEAYAAVQHEVLWFKHAVGQAKYIEIPVMLICDPEMAPMIAKEVQIALDEFHSGVTTVRGFPNLGLT